MKFLRGIETISTAQQHCVVSIGNFDGVHLGHQAVLKQVIAKARALHVPCGVILFEPQPQEYFQVDPPARISSLREKITIIREMGIDFVLCLRFDKKLAQCTAQEFVQKVLVQGLKVRHVIVGDDFRFGHNRTGDFAFLTAAGKHANFTVSDTQEVQIEGQRVSSTRVREALAKGDIAETKKLLGRDYALIGKVITGDQRGRTLGFPTANIAMHRKKNPIKGVYIVYVAGLGKTLLPAVANIGVRPTVDGNQPLLEVHLLDYESNFYGAKITVIFLAKIRDEKKFETIEALRAQIAGDVMMARHYFKTRQEHD